MSNTVKYLVVGIILMTSLGAVIPAQALVHATRAGETIGLPLGWQHELSRETLTVTITPASGLPVIYEPNHPNVRGLVNAYPDPVSRLRVGAHTHQDLGVEAEVYEQKLHEQVTNQEQDWWETTLFVDLPDSLPEGPASVTVSGPQGLLTPESLQLEILAGSGSPSDPLDHLVPSEPQMQASFVEAMERAQHFTVTFSGPSVPHCIQLDLFRDAGIGTPWVINPRGDLKNVTWGDDGGKLRVLLTPPNGQTPGHVSHFKFYVAGGVSGLQVAALKAYDQAGNVMSDVLAQIGQ